MRSKTIGWLSFSVKAGAVRRKGLAALLIATLLGNLQCGTGPESGETGFDSDPVATVAEAISVPPVVTPPARAVSAAVGAISASGSVGPDGQYRYSVPIEIPDGRNGMAPKLSLQYSSGGADGMLGVGWSVGGLSAIARCPRTEAQEGIRERITFDNPFDNYCLNGQRLVLVSGSNAFGNAVYKTEFDSGVRVKVTSTDANGPRTWQLEDGSGRVATYGVYGGNAVTRRTLNASGAVASTQTVYLNWPILSERDAFNNAISYAYNNLGGDGSSNGIDVPTEISYGHCSGACGTWQDVRRVVFNYETRPAGDQFETYLNGVRIKRAVRLKDITSQIITGTGLVTVTNYRVAYQQSTVSGRSLVTSLTRCDAAGVCMPATTFEWAGLGASYATYQTAQRSNASPTTISTDLEGGGFPHDSTMAVFDANGDGNDDVIIKRWQRLDNVTLRLPNGTANGANPQTNGNEDLLLLGDGGGYFRPPVAIDHDGDGITRWTQPCGEMEITDLGGAVPVDLDGNGTVELVARVNTGCPFKELQTVDIKQYVRVIPGIAEADLPPGYGWTVFSWNPASQSLREWSVARIKAVPFNSSVQFIDVDGDGLRDIASALTGSEWKYTLATLTPQLVGPPLLSYGTTVSTGLFEERGVAKSVTVSDYDADGREDLISANVTVTSGQFGQQSMFRLGSNNVGGVTTRETEPGRTTGYEFRIDINGDGLKDSLYRHLQPADPNNAWRIRINTGNGYTAPSSVGGADVAATFSRMFPESEIVMPNLYKVDSGIRIADLNGDRRDDVLIIALNTDAQVSQPIVWTALSARNVRVMYSNGSGFNPPVNIADRGASMGPMSVPTKRWPFQAVADVDGNGLPDLVEFLQSGLTNPTRVLTVHRLPNLQGGTDVITRIRDERGVAADILTDALSGGTYARFGGGTDVHVANTHNADVGEACVYPAACTARGRAVRELRDYRTPRITQVGYDYRGARADKQGRGSLGFTKHGALDAVSGRYTIQTFSQSSQGFFTGLRTVYAYPDLATPRRTEVSFPPTGTLSSFGDLAATVGGRSGSISTWSPTYRSGYPVMKERTVVVTDNWQAPSTRHTTVTTQTDFEATYQLPTREQTTFSDLVSGLSTRQTTTTSFIVDPNFWLIRRPLNVSITKETSDDARDNGCTTLPCASSTVTYDYAYVTNTAAPLTRTRKHGSETLVTRYVRGNGGLVTAEREEVGATIQETQFAYDPLGAYVIGRRTPAGLESWTLHDPSSGWVSAEIDPNGIKAVHTRDGFGRVTRTARDDGYAENFQYRTGRVDGFPNDGGSWAVNYDERGRKVRYRWVTFDNRTGDEQTQYASCGEPSTSSYGFEGSVLTRRWAKTYDRDCRLVREVNGQNDAPGSGAITTYTYDTALGVVTATDPRGDTKTMTRDLRGLVKKVTTRSAQPNSGVASLTTDYKYDETGTLSVIKGNGPIERIRNDALGRLTRWETVDPGTSVTAVRTAVTYDSFGNKTNVTQDGISVTFGYDADGRVISRTAPSSETQTFVWDTATKGKGKLTSATGAGGHQTRFTYDTFGRLQEARDVFSTGESLSVGYTYDSVGRLSILRYPETSNDVPGHATTGGLQVRHVYAANGQLARLEEVGPNTVLWQVNTRHPLGKVTSYTDAAGLVTTTNIEEGLVMPTERTTRTSTGTTVASQVFGRDSDLSAFAHQFTLNGATTTESYAHNGYGQTTGYRREGLNPVNATMSYTTLARDTGNFDAITVAATSNAPDFPSNEQFTKVANSERISGWAQAGGPSETITFDNAGRIQSTTGAGGLANRTYTYNSFNLPTRIVNGNVTTDFTYDAYGKRVKKRRDANNQVLYVRDLYEQRTVASPSTTEAVFRLVTDEGVAGEVVKNWTNGSVTRRMFQNDRQGSPFIMTVGTTASLYGAFSPYGRRINAAPAQNMSNLGYTGHVMDDDLGLIDMKGRVYDTRLRRFLTRDPVIDAPFDVGGHNAYTYVRGNPIGLVDPTGLEGESDSKVRIENDPRSEEIVDVVITIERTFQLPTDVSLAFLASLIQADVQGGIPVNSAFDSSTGTAAPIMTPDPTYAAMRLGQAEMEYYDKTTGLTPITEQFALGALGGVIGKALGAMASLGLRSLAGGRLTGTVWDAIRATQPTWRGTVIPRSFELTTKNGSVWVHGNATEHLAEFANAMLGRGVNSELVNLGSQMQLTSLEAAVSTAIKGGVPYNEMVTVGGWQLKFMEARGPLQLPALVHAMPFF